MSRNSYLSSRPSVPEFVDLAHAAVGSISHPDFVLSLRYLDDDEGGRLALAISSDTRQHEVPPQRLDGTESMVAIYGIARGMIGAALAQDLDYRFKVNGSPIFARGAA